MVVDDSLTVRTVFSRMIENDPALQLATTASNAERAIAILREKPVDVILLDLEMPGMGGLEALPKILETADGAQVLVVSSLTEDGAEHTVAALSMGAADTMLKPRPGGFDNAYRATLLDKIHALGGLDREEAQARSQTRSADLRETAAVARQRHKQPEVIAIGGSTGAIHALNILLRDLPRSFDLPILITQHLPANFIPVFARQVEMVAARPTRIAEDGTEIRRGEIAIATGHGHMVVKRERDRLVARISAVPARSGCLPSVDPMLASLAETTAGHALAVILSGMGRDGVEGAAELVAAGGRVLAQDQASSAVWGMPGAVVSQGIATVALPPEALLKEILDCAGVAAWK
ncbi:chemotaxis-specific protein-glutamate methyltransferase CheB [Altererythrobacter sp. Z27]|uniref:chemotaxis-specific protein-glutamate methyltransferase CheB n=1 Tax=Altererythrobacter sp. Z27 TaxID=3461147 RepID=UPI004043C313